MSEFVEVKIAAPLEATLDEIEYESVRRLLEPCNKNPSRIAKILHRSPQQIKAILAKRCLSITEKLLKKD
jgi:ActR/RegA family two-component response regulator